MEADRWLDRVRNQRAHLPEVAELAVDRGVVELDHLLPLALGLIGAEDELELVGAQAAVLPTETISRSDQVDFVCRNEFDFTCLELAQGKNREVRRLFEVLGHEVVQLCRVQIGPVRLAELPPGKWRVLTPAEIKSLLPARS